MRIIRAVQPLEYVRVYGAFWDTVIDGETGFLVPPRDPQALAAATELRLGVVRSPS